MRNTSSAFAAGSDRIRVVLSSRTRSRRSADRESSGHAAPMSRSRVIPFWECPDLRPKATRFAAWRTAAHSHKRTLGRVLEVREFSPTGHAGTSSLSYNGTGVSGVRVIDVIVLRPTHSEIKTRTPSRNPAPPCTLVDDLARLRHHQPPRRTSHENSALRACAQP